MDIQHLKKQIVQRLRPLQPQRVIMFGSQATGQAQEHSDIDIYVVTRDHFMPGSWREKNQVYLQISRQLRDLQVHIPIDIIVHTIPMFQEFVRLNSVFCREVLEHGEVLYESGA